MWFYYYVRRVVQLQMKKSKDYGWEANFVSHEQISKKLWMHRRTSFIIVDDSLIRAFAHWLRELTLTGAANFLSLFLNHKNNTINYNKKSMNFEREKFIFSSFTKLNNKKRKQGNKRLKENKKKKFI